MSANKQLRKILLCLGIEAAALLGAPIRPDDVEDLLRRAQRVKIESTIRREQEDSDDPVPANLEGAFLSRFLPGGGAL